MISVLNVSSDLNIGGAGRCILHFLAHYDRSKFTVDVAVPRGSLLIPEIEQLDTRAILVDGMGDKSLDLRAIRALRNVIREVNPQLVHTHGAMSARIAAKQCKKKVIYTRHSVFPVSRKLASPPGRRLNGWINERYADAIIAVADAAKENLVESGICPSRVEVIQNGVPVQTKLSSAEIAEEKAKYGIDHNRFVLGILARLEPVKGHEYLLAATKWLKDQCYPITVLIAGAGGIENELKARATQLGLEDTVIFTGFVPDVVPLLSILDLQINASWGTEATSLALLEGMSMGIPAVVTEYGGNPGVITQGKNGVLVPVKDADALANTIATMMMDKTAYARMVEGCHAIFAQKFRVDQYVRNIEAVYQRVAAEKSGG